MQAGGLLRPNTKIITPIINFKSNLIFSGSQSLRMILTELKNLFPTKKFVIVPNYLCNDVEKVILKCNLKPIFINTDPELNLDIVQIKSSIEKKTLGIIIPRYFGYKDRNLNHLIELCSESRISIIEDFVGVADTFSRIKFEYSNTYKFNSLRKFLPLFSGSEFSNVEKSILTFDPVFNEEMTSFLNTAKKNQNDFLDSNEFRIVEEFYQTNKNRKEMVHIDLYSAQYLQKIDLEKCAVQRATNYSFLKNLFVSNAKLSEYIKLFRGYEPDNLPLHLILIIEKDRDGLRNYLLSRNILAPVHWQNNVSVVEESPSAKVLKSKILSIPIDFRLNSETLFYIFNSFLKYYQIDK